MLFRFLFLIFVIELSLSALTISASPMWLKNPNLTLEQFRAALPKADSITERLPGDLMGISKHYLTQEGDVVSVINKQPLQRRSLSMFLKDGFDKKSKSSFRRQIALPVNLFTNVTPSKMTPQPTSRGFRVVYQPSSTKPIRRQHDINVIALPTQEKITDFINKIYREQVLSRGTAAAAASSAKKTKKRSRENSRPPSSHTSPHKKPRLLYPSERAAMAAAAADTAVGNPVSNVTELEKKALKIFDDPYSDPFMGYPSMGDP